MRGGGGVVGGGVVVVGCAWGPARRGFFGGGCTVVGSWGVWVFARLGAARRGGFWRLRIWVARQSGIALQINARSSRLATF